MKPTKYCMACMLFIFTSSANAQVKYKNASSSGLQYGFSLNLFATIEARRPLIKICTNAGIASNALSFIFPSYNLQVQLYNGGLGTAYPRPKLWPVYMDIAHSFMATVGGVRAHNKMTPQKYALRNAPLYYFSDFGIPALQNPYQFSLSLGTNLISGYGPHRRYDHEPKRLQRTGFFNAHIGLFQFGYSNDGTPFNFSTLLCDEKDRSYTGDGFAAIHLPRNWEVNTYLLSYHKFTGYYKEAFELSNLLYLGDANYGDTNQQYLNRSLFRFTASSLSRGLSLSLDFKNRYFKDIQNLIHRNDYWSLHRVPYPYKKGLTAGYFYTSTYIIPHK